MVKISFEGETTLEILKSMQGFIAELAGSRPVSKTEKHNTPVVDKVKAKKASVSVPEVKEIPRDEIKPVVADIFDLELPKDLDSRPVKNPNPLVKAFTKDDIRAALQNVMTNHGLPKVQEILGKFGIDSISKLDSKRYHELMAVVENTNQI